PIFENIKQKTRSLVEINENKMITLRDESKIIARNATSITLAISGFTILIGIFFVLYLTNKIIRPVRDLIQKTRNIADRNYDQQINIIGKDEIAALATEFNIMASKLKQYDQLNIKQLMKEKQKVETIVESISDGVIVTGAENRILLINKAAEKIFNIKESEAIKKDFLEIIKNDDLLNYINDIKIKRIFSIDNYLDIKIKRKGVLEYFRAIAKAITNIEGEGVGVVTLLQNITKLKEVDKLKSEFISSISHELRTPITSVIMATEILDKEIPGQLNAEQKKMTKIILEDGNRLKELINDILDLSRLESGKITFNLKPNNLRDIADSAIKLFEIQKKETDIEIINAIDKKLPGVLADFSKISEVFTNLIANSINYKNKDRKLKITISAKEADDVMVISFSDNGRGISEEDQKKIFDRFVRVDETEAYESIAGTGLGLAISKDIINKHGGKIWVESRLSRGTTFYITLNKIKDKEKFNDRKE
ncbi:MAG: cell wall metabolism sensor histidine kinase WalK, partial [Actinobacteria bacterium]|nr:cell wall metabolism sensor histidine kinase WalK [Actinomycetota bacterium]